MFFLNTQPLFNLAVEILNSRYPMSLFYVIGSLENHKLLSKNISEFYVTTDIMAFSTISTVSLRTIFLQTFQTFYILFSNFVEEFTVKICLNAGKMLRKYFLILSKCFNMNFLNISMSFRLCSKLESDYILIFNFIIFHDQI